MGADLYLPSILHDCHQRYGQAAHWLEEALALAQGEVGSAVWTESQRLKTALLQHAEQIGEMSPALYDLVTDIADLAQGELNVSTRALAESIETLITQMQASSPGDEAPGVASAVPFVHALVQVLRGQHEEVIHQGARWLAYGWRSAPTLFPHAETRPTIPPLLLRASACFLELLEGHPQRAVAFLLEDHLLPTLAHASTDQREALTALHEALEPLGALAAPEAAIGEIGSTLTRFAQLAGRLHETLETFRLQVDVLLHADIWEEARLRTQLSEARERLDALWHDYTALQPALETATETFIALLRRVLSFPGMEPARPLLPQQAPSPLQQTLGLLLRQQMLWQGMRNLLTREGQLLEQALAGDVLPVLQALCSMLVKRLAQEQEPALATVERSLTRRVHPVMPASVQLLPGVTLAPATSMDACFVQIMAAIHQQEQEDPLRAWVRRVLLEEPMTTSVTGSLLRFWLLLQDGNPLFWAEWLLAHAQECLSSKPAWDSPQEADVRALVEQCQGLLREQPALRLQDRLAALREQVPPASPLSRPAERLHRLVQGQTDEHLREAIALLAQEGQQRQEWPEAVRQDFCWLIQRAQHLLDAPGDRQAQVVLRALLDCQQEWPQPRRTDGPADDGDPAWEPASVSALLSQALADPTREQRVLRLVAEQLRALPEPGVQPPRVDPRLVPGWRLRLLGELVDRCLEAHKEAGEEAEAAPAAADPDELAACVPLLEPILALLQRLVRAWRFPPQGSFRDPYNDTSILWIAAGIFWPEMAPVLTEPVTQPDPHWADWLPPGQTPLAQMPLARIRDLRELLCARELTLPSRQHLQRWGAPTIRLDEGEQGPYSLSAWYAFFARRKEQFLAFLDEALAREEPILCSL